MKVAFGMEDDKNLTDGHYGDSKYFLIYEFDGEKFRLVEKRENKAASMNEEAHGDIKKFKAVISQLEDVDVLAAFRMGPNFLRIKGNTTKKVIFTKTRELEKALEVVVNELKSGNFKG